LRREYHAGLDQCILRTLEILSVDAECLASQARLWLNNGQVVAGSPVVQFSALPIALQRQCVRSQLIDAGHAPDFELVERLRLEPGRRWEISSGRVASLNAQGRVEVKQAEAAEFLSHSAVLPLEAKAGEANFGGLHLRWRVVAGSRAKVNRGGPGSEVFDADRVGRRITLRHWRPGDRFWPIGGPGETKLQDVFTNEKVPMLQRRKLVMGCAEHGEVFWVQGLRIGERFKVTKHTKNRLHLRWSQRVHGRAGRAQNSSLSHSPNSANSNCCIATMG
jgi:tRNA(Ile)-lysidine synthase